jgi:hypothetical protein
MTNIRNQSTNYELQVLSLCNVSMQWYFLNLWEISKVIEENYTLYIQFDTHFLTRCSHTQKLGTVHNFTLFIIKLCFAKYSG